jgi:hypothetical protein
MTRHDSTQTPLRPLSPLPLFLDLGPIGTMPVNRVADEWPDRTWLEKNGQLAFRSPVGLP